MSSPFVAEIRIFPFNFAPSGWAFCDGQLLPISQNTALFSVLGTQYGGNGTTTFALPNLQGNLAIHSDQYAAGTQYPIGALGGEETHTLLGGEMPVHAHAVQCDPLGLNAKASSPNNAVPGNPVSKQIYSDAAASITMNPAMVGVAGGSQPHNNLMPYLVLNYCIALQGLFPPRG